MNKWKKAALWIVGVYILAIIAMNIATVSLYYTSITLGILFLSIVAIGMIVTPIYLLMPVTEWGIRKLGFSRESTISKAATIILIALVYLLEIKILSDYEFGMLPQWLNFSGYQFIVPTVVLLLCLIPTYIYRKSIQSFSTEEMFGFYYASNLAVMGVLFAPYLMDWVQ